MEETERRSKLGHLLRSCRERTTPLSVGITSSNQRRTPGLRREEAAILAGISPAYYTKIEQGRVVVSHHVLNTLAAVFNLSPAERDYAFALATSYVATEDEIPAEEMNPMLDRLLVALDPYPAQILNHRWDFLGWNEASCTVLGDLGAVPAEMRNLVALMFLAPQMREMIDNWEGNACRMLAEFRADHGRYHFDPDFGKLIAFLRENSPDFDHWWTTVPTVGGPGNAFKTINHTMGTLRLQETVLDVHDHPGLRLILFLPQDKSDEQHLRRIVAAS